MSPSLEVHRRMGEVVCNFYDHEIDKMADEFGLSEKLFDELIERWDVEGLCYYLLHRMLDRVEESITDMLSRFGEAYVNGETTAERAYEVILKSSFEELSKISFEKTGNEKKDEVVDLFREFIVATLNIGWENVIASIVLDRSKDELLLVRRVVDRLKRKRNLRRSMDKVWKFMEDFCVIASERLSDVEKTKKKRIKTLKKNYDKIVPKIRDVLKELGIKT